MILPGVHIGDGAIIGANSVVGSNVEPYSIAAGNPVRNHRVCDGRLKLNEFRKLPEACLMTAESAKI